MEYFEKVEIDMARRSVYLEHPLPYPLQMRFYHSHSDYELLYIRSGRLSVANNTETVTLSAPALVLHHPYMPHRASTDGKEPYERYILYFNKDLAQRLRVLFPEFQKVFGGCMSYLSLDSECAKRLDGYCTQLENCIAESQFRRSEILLMFLLEDILTAVPSERIHTVQEKHSYISEVLVTIADNCEQELTVEGLAKQFFVSRTKLAADFKDFTCMTVKQYILLTKINHAKRLLNAPGMTLSTVAQKCGFCDDSHFINTFRRFEGITPKEYLMTKRQSGLAQTH